MTPLSVIATVAALVVAAVIVLAVVGAVLSWVRSNGYWRDGV